MKKLISLLLLSFLLAACTREVSDAPAIAVTTEIPIVQQGTPAAGTAPANLVAATATVAPLAVCADSQPTRLNVGMTAYIDLEQPLPNNVRAEAGTESELIGTIDPGESVTILAGPTCAEGFTWWQVQLFDDTIGWTAEADHETYWLIPTEGQTASSAAASSVANNRNGMSWGVFANVFAGDGIVMVGCAAGDKTCNPAAGDTACTVEMPILCYKPAPLPRPNYALQPFGRPEGDETFNGWAGGYIGLTTPISGASLSSLSAANNICQAELGAGYRMAESHDGKFIQGMGLNSYYGGSWPQDAQLSSGNEAFYSYGTLSSKARFWVAINDQAGNCWNQ